MFGMSVKSVPGCLVLIVPRLIGVPVAATPCLGPHDDVPAEALALLVVALALAVLLLLAGALLELLLLLLPHAASAISVSAASSASATRLWGTTCLVLTDCLLSSGCEPGPGPPEVGRY